MNQGIDVEEALKDSRYLNEMQRIDRSKVALTTHAIGRYYEHLHLGGRRQNWEEMPANTMLKIRKSQQWIRSEQQVRDLLVRADWRTSSLSRKEKLQKEKLHPGNTFYFKCYRCNFVVARHKDIPGAYVLVTMWFLEINE